jgi:N-hydroxyarylamine O-acetyltransferase
MKTNSFDITFRLFCSVEKSYLFHIKFFPLFSGLAEPRKSCRSEFGEILKEFYGIYHRISTAQHSMPQLLTDYLARIKYNGPLDVSLDTLTAIHRGHRFNIPFETLDLFTNTPIEHSIEKITQHVIYNKRGHVCTGSHLLLQHVLEQLGFDVQMFNGRVIFANMNEMPMRGHYLLCVTVNDEEYLVDAGFGVDTPRGPLPLSNLGTIHECEGQKYRIIESTHFPGAFTLQMQIESDWKDLCVFTKERVYEIDCTVGMAYIASNPVFITANLIVSKHTNEGSIVLFNSSFKQVCNGKVISSKISSTQELGQVLLDYFDIKYDTSHPAIQKLFQ